MDAVYYVSIVAQFLTYASFLSGARVCHVIHKQKSCAKLSPMPFLAGLNCTALWLRYGFIADEWEIIAINVVGLALQVIYLGFFVAYSRQRSRLVKQLLTLFVLQLTLLWSISKSADPKFLAGSLASLSTTIACASPLATIQEVFKTKCVASLPLPIIASSFVVSVSWLIFGILKEDNFIVFSNCIALAIGGAQLTLFAIYPSRSPYEKMTHSNKKSYVSTNDNMHALAQHFFSQPLAQYWHESFMQLIVRVQEILSSICIIQPKSRCTMHMSLIMSPPSHSTKLLKSTSIITTDQPTNHIMSTLITTHTHTGPGQKRLIGLVLWLRQPLRNCLQISVIHLIDVIAVSCGW